MKNFFNQNKNNQDEEKKVIDIDTSKYASKIKKMIPTVLVVILLLIAGLNSVYMLQDRENGVILRFGKVHGVVTSSGLNFKVPFIERVRKVDVRTIYGMEYGYRTAKAGTEESPSVYTDDNREATVIVDGANNNASIGLIELIIQYRVDDPVDFLFNVDDVPGTIKLALEDSVRTTVQSLTIEEARTQKERISQEVLPLLQRKLDDYGAGIKVTLVATQNFQFLPNVEKALQQKENANQYKNGKREDAEKYNNTVIPQAEAEARKLVEEANGYKAKTVADANAGVANFNALYTEYLNNPDILKEKYYLEAMTSFLTNNKIVIDGASQSSVYKFYNLDENAVKKSVVE